MILIGQYDSPFVRRVAIALDLYGMPFEHRPWSTFSDAEALAAFNPLRRVPTLILDDGEVLIESLVILDYLDQQVGPERSLIPASGEPRRRQLRVSAFAAGLADKAVSLLYERLLRSEQSERWVARCRTQIADTLKLLEADRAAVSAPYWFGETIGHADIITAAMLRFLGEAHPDLWRPRDFPALAAQAARCEALDPFQRIVQPLIAPK
jgi:glutathione S-transferase